MIDSNYTPIKYNGYVQPDVPFSIQPNQDISGQNINLDQLAEFLKYRAQSGNTPSVPSTPSTPALQNFNQYNPIQYIGGGGSNSYNNAIQSNAQSTAAIQGAQSNSFMPDSSTGQSTLGRFGNYVQNKLGDVAGNFAQAGITGLGYALGGPIGGLIGGFIGKDAKDTIQSTIKNPTNNDPYAAYRTSTSSNYSTPSINEGMSGADQYAAYAAGRLGQTNPNSNSNYSAPSGNEGMSVASQYGSYGAGRSSGDSSGSDSSGGGDSGGDSSSNNGGDRGTRGGF